MKGTHKHSEAYWYILTITDVFLNQRRVNVCEHTVKMEPQIFPPLLPSFCPAPTLVTLIQKCHVVCAIFTVCLYTFTLHLEISSFLWRISSSFPIFVISVTEFIKSVSMSMPWYRSLRQWKGCHQIWCFTAFIKYIFLAEWERKKNFNTLQQWAHRNVTAEHYINIDKEVDWGNATKHRVCKASSQHWLQCQRRLWGVGVLTSLINHKEHWGFGPFKKQFRAVEHYLPCPHLKQKLCCQS